MVWDRRGSNWKEQTISKAVWGLLFLTITSHYDWCYGLEICVLTKRLCGNLTPKGDGIRRSCLQEMLRLWELSPQEWNQCPLVKRLELPSAFHPGTLQWEVGWPSERKWALTRHTTAGAMALGFSASRTVRNRCLLSINHPVYETLLWQQDGQRQSRMHNFKTECKQLNHLSFGS